MGVVTGLDWSAFLALIPSGCQRDRVLALATPYEAGLIEGALELVKKA